MQGVIVQRLVGAVVLVIAAVVLVPLVFKERVSNHFLQPMNVPDKPVKPEPLVKENDYQFEPIHKSLEREQKPYAEAEPTEQQLAKLEAPKTAEPPKKNQRDSSAPAQTVFSDKPNLDKQGLPVAWTLQLASFSKKGNAEALQKKLVNNGYKSYLRTVFNSKGAPIVRVYVGPDLQISKIKALQRALQAELDLKGLVVRFKPSPA